MKNTSQKSDDNLRSLFFYNDLYRYFFSKKITNIDNELKNINKNKILMKNANKFGDDFKYIYQLNNLLNEKRKKYNFNFVTFNLYKIYLYKYSNDNDEFKDLSNFLDKLFYRIINDTEILYKLNKDFYSKATSEYSEYTKIKNIIERSLSAKKIDSVDIFKFLELDFGKKSVNAEFIISGYCEKIKETNRKNKNKKESNKSSTDISTIKDQKKNVSNSCKDIGNSPVEIIQKSSRSVQNDDNHSMNSKTSSFVSITDSENVNEEEIKSNIETNSNFSPDNDISTESYNTTANVKERKASMSMNNSNSSLLSAEQANPNIQLSRNQRSFSSSSSTIRKNQLEDDINCNFLNELDSIYLFNVKRDLMKNIFSLNFLDTIFYDKAFLKLRKIFYQIYGHKLESKIENFPTLNYPTKIKNFSNGLEPSLFVKPYNDFFVNRAFNITHEYFNNYIKRNEIKFKTDHIILYDKEITIPTKEKTYIYKCELI